MRIKIIGENNCARATRHLLRVAGFAVTEFLPADAVATGPLAGYAITIDLAPAPLTPEPCLRPDPPTHQSHSAAREEASRSHRDASLPASVRQDGWRTTADEPASASANADLSGTGSADLVPLAEISANATPAGGASSSTLSPAVVTANAGEPACASASTVPPAVGTAKAGESAVAPANFRSGGGIHFDSVDSALEAAVLRHVTQLAVAPVIVDRPGGVVHSDRELRIVAPNTGDAAADEAAAVAIEFGVLRGLLDLTALAAHHNARGSGSGVGLINGDGGHDGDDASASSRRAGGKKWWLFGIVLLAGALWIVRGDFAAAPGRGVVKVAESHRLKPALLEGARGLMGRDTVKSDRLKPVLLGASLVGIAAGFEEAQGQFANGEGFKITDGINFLVVDPCKGQTKLFASISQTGNVQLVGGTASKKIYVCSIHVVAAAATDVAVVEGTGSVCGTSTAGVSGFGGATAATGWNFAANGGIALGNGDSSLGAEGTSGDNLCIFNSGSGQVSGGISYVVE